VDAHGVMIYFLELGHGAPPVIVHGGPGASLGYFLPYPLPLARHNLVIFIDERGSGRSQKLEDPSGYAVENMVEDVEDVRQALGLGKISLLGHSYGGVLTQAHALKYQSNLPHLILCSTFPSTAQMNQVFQKMKANMAPDLREHIGAFEKGRPFRHGKGWEENRYTADYMITAWTTITFPTSTGIIPTRTTTLCPAVSRPGLSTARRGAQMVSS
jgi:proline-specific peptidase